MHDQNGKWIGWGPGDNDPKVHEIKAFLKRKFTWVRNFQPPLNDSPLYDQTLTIIVGQMQGNYGLPVTGIMDYATQLKSGFYKPPVPQIERRPIIFTVDGHMSDMFRGPCAVIAQALERENLVWHQPIGYNNSALPFDNESGIRALYDLVSAQTMPNGRPFPPGTPWGLVIHSQGGIIGAEFLMRYVLPVNGELHWRLKDFRGGIGLGNPYREVNQCASWVPDPPKRDTQGIADKHFEATKITLEDGRRMSDLWREHARTGDLYAENDLGEVGLNKTAVYRIAAWNQWWGGPTGMLARVLDLMGNPFDGFADMAWAIITGMMFLINSGPHVEYDLTPCIDFMRNRIRA